MPHKKQHDAAWHRRMAIVNIALAWMCVIATFIIGFDLPSYRWIIVLNQVLYGTAAILSLMVARNRFRLAFMIEASKGLTSIAVLLA